MSQRKMALIPRAEKRHQCDKSKIVSIGLDYSWFVIFALFTWSPADSYYPAEFKNWPPLLYWFMGESIG
jgi:hypothetical protein